MPSGVLIPVTVTIDGVKKTFPSLAVLALHLGFVQIRLRRLLGVVATATDQFRTGWISSSCVKSAGQTMLGNPSHLKDPACSYVK
jgi:hypothetical protein